MAFNTIKTMLIALTTTPSAAIALPIPAGSVDLKGCYWRAFCDSGVAVMALGGSGVASSKTPTTSALPDGNIPIPPNVPTEPQHLPAGASYISAVAAAGTPNLWLELGYMDSNE